jgi:hypothetical protein
VAKRTNQKPWDNLTAIQLGALEEIDLRGHLTAGWGGYGLSTLRSLAGRGLVKFDTLGTGETASLTGTGIEAVQALGL